MKRTQPLVAMVCSLSLVLLLFVSPVRAKEKFAHAVTRSQDAGTIIASLALVPESGLPKELVDKAVAVAVFPKVIKEVALFTHLIQGYGVISSRTKNGWTLPAFYQFAGGGYGNPFAAGDTYGVILLFMTTDAVAAFEKGGVPLKGEKKALAGPIGTITGEQRKELEGAHILAYAYFNGRLRGTAFGKSFWKGFGLNPDNNINKPVYGMKGREVLTGKEVNQTSLPAGIDAYQVALHKYYAPPS
jgi:lipid-binding SYLF domain-containing protein